MLRKLTLCFVCLAVLGGGVAQGTTQAKKERCIGIHQGINYYRNAAHKWQVKLGVPITKSSKTPIVGCKYAAWVADLWRNRAKKLHVAYNHYVQTYLKFERANRNIWRAIEFAGPIFGVSTSRLHHRVSSEGGHGDFVMNKDGSDAGGWFQFMPGTFYDYSRTALIKAGVPLKYNDWTSPLGQAVTAAYMFDIGLECAGVGWAASC